MNEFILPVRVYYEDTDSGGVVYHTNYLKFMERARIDPGIIFSVYSIRVNYLKPAKFNQMLQASAKVERLNAASILFYQKIETELSGENILMCESWIKVACVSSSTLRPIRLPETIKREIMGGS